LSATPSEPKQPTPEREQTDESLRVEREKADDAFGDGPSELDETADAIIGTARARADAVLAAARARMDRKAASVPLVAQSPGTLAAERLLEDRVLQSERTHADDALREERAAHAAILAVERAETDKDLSRERERADHAVATRDEFLGVVSHDLRNMLAATVGFAGLIEAEVARENRATKVLSYTQRIQRSAGRMNRLIGDLVDLASIEAGQLAVTREEADASHLVTEAVDTFHPQAEASAISLVTEIVPPLPRAMLDPARILQVLVNLLSNAIKFTPRGGTVGVRVECIGRELRFIVRDTGIGIPTDKLEAVFERFVQVAKNDRRGVGLGLYISKCIVQGHGGRIWARSIPGEGSTFSFSLPLQIDP
jgi:signal transduction histidine kinase